jgi:hypothetical protein
MILYVVSSFDGAGLAERIPAGVGLLVGLAEWRADRRRPGKHWSSTYETLMCEVLLPSGREDAP